MTFDRFAVRSRPRLSTGFVATSALWALLVTAGVPTPGRAAPVYDVVLTGGRVMDPESGLDRVANVAIKDGKVMRIAGTPLDGLELVDVSGLVVAPGFIDLHAHGQNTTSRLYQARDGVTTALDLEAGAFPVAAFFADQTEGSPIHYGVAVGHIPARIRLKHGVDVVHPLVTPATRTGIKATVLGWLRWLLDPREYAEEAATAAELTQLEALIRQGLDEGGIGVGFGLDYTPAATSEEFRRVAALAAERGQAVFVHMRGGRDPGDQSPLTEVLDVARATGVAAHVVHITSSGLGRTDAYLAAIDAARGAGLDVTTEVYPYTAASTQIESAFFDEGWRERTGADYGDLQWPPTDERLTAESFARYRAEGGDVILHMMTEDMVTTALAHPGVLVASDGIPLFGGGEHPRGVGTFSRVLGRYVREKGTLELMDALSRMTLLPARRLEAFVPAMRGKGRIRVGADADITVFDPQKVIDRATFEDSRRFSEGIEHVLVDGVFVVRGGDSVDGARPGRPLRTTDAITR
jgi:N-acyl-D-aspartate/D-glutamate deacylase